MIFSIVLDMDRKRGRKPSGPRISGKRRKITYASIGGTTVTRTEPTHKMVEEKCEKEKEVLSANDPGDDVDHLLDEYFCESPSPTKEQVTDPEIWMVDGAKEKPNESYRGFWILARHASMRKHSSYDIMQNQMDKGWKIETNPQTLLGRLYMVPLKLLSLAMRKCLRKTLTITPKAIGGSFSGAKKDAPRRIVCYAEDKDRGYAYVPKFFGLRFFGPPQYDREIQGKPLPDTLRWNPEYSLRTDVPQQETFDLAVTQLENIGGGGIVLPCGCGKTPLAIALALHQGRKTIILTTVSCTFEQWAKEIVRFTSGPVRIGLLQARSIHVWDEKDEKWCSETSVGIVRDWALPLSIGDEYDFLIASGKTVVRDYCTPQSFTNVGTCIFDEGHTLATWELSRVFSKVACKNMLFLTATPSRRDGSYRMLEWFCGSQIIRVQDVQKETMPVHVHIYRRKDMDLQKKLNSIKVEGVYRLAAIKTYVADQHVRNVSLATMAVRWLYEKEPFLCLCERKNHCEVLLELTRDIFTQKYPEIEIPIMGLYHGNISAKDRKYVKENAMGMFGTIQACGIGFSVKRLSRLLWGCAISASTSFEQGLGRVMRDMEGKSNVHIHDIVDVDTEIEGCARARERFYKGRRYNITIHALSS
jgi:superfamily II DNA or RNA helicase